MRYLYVRLILSPDICPSRAHGCDSPYGMLFIARDDVLLLILAYEYRTVSCFSHQSVCSYSTRTVSYRTCRKSCQYRYSYCTKRVRIPYSIEHDECALSVLNMMSARCIEHSYSTVLYCSKYCLFRDGLGAAPKTPLSVLGVSCV